MTDLLDRPAFALTDRPRAGTQSELQWLYAMADRATGPERRAYLAEAAAVSKQLHPHRGRAPKRRRKAL